MGIDRWAAEFLIACERDGADFSDTLTLGRQSLYLSRWQARALGIPESLADDEFSDEVFRRLGARRIVSMDASDFEGAEVVHDLNLPLPPELVGAFSAVVDSGTLEHVFDVRAALRGALSAVAPGGHFMTIAPANNECGHGFYQFSPELWFRVLSPANGFEIESMFMREMHPRGRWYRVTDPAELGGRVGFRSRHATYLFARARRIADAEILAANPQQSDYVVRWEGGSTRSAPARRLTTAERARKSMRIRTARASETYRRVRGREIEDPFVRVQFAEHVRHFHPVDAP